MVTLLTTLAGLVLYGPIFRGQLPLPVTSIDGIFTGQPDRAAGPGIFRDRIVQTHPYHQYAAAAIQHGRWPMWNDLIFAGTPFFANGQAGLLSPTKLPLWWLPDWLSYDIAILLQFVVAGIGFALFGRNRGWSTAASALAALTLVLSGSFLFRSSVATMSAVAAWLPWLLWAIDRLQATLRWRWVGGVALTGAALIFSGHIQLAVLLLGFALVWAVGTWLTKEWRRRLMMLIVGFGLIGGLAAVQLLPAKEATSQAYRQPVDRSWRSVLAPSQLFKFNLKQASAFATTVDPNILGNESNYRGPANYLEGNLYLGPLALLAIGFSVLAWRDRRWWITVGLTAVPVIWMIFPNTWRVMGKLAPWLTVTPVWRTSFIFSVGAALLVGFGAHLVLKRWPRWGIAVVVLAAGVSLWQWQNILPFGPRDQVFPPSQFMNQVKQVTGQGRLLTPNGTLDQFMPYQVPVVFGYDSVYPRSYYELWAANSEIRKKNQLHARNIQPSLMTVVTANAVVAKSELIPADWVTKAQSGPWVLATRPESLPVAWSVQNVVTETSPQQLQTIDPLTTALVSGDLPIISPDAKVEIATTTNNPERLQLLVNTTDPTVIVTNHQAYPGWKLIIDGQDAGAALLTVNHTMMGAAVSSPGTHTVEFRYQPTSFRIGLLVSLVSLLLVSGMLVYDYRLKNHPDNKHAA